MMKYSKKVLEDFQITFSGTDTMWKVMLNSIQLGLNDHSKNYSSEIFKRINLRGFRVLDCDNKPVLYGLSSAMCREPLERLKEHYQVSYIEYAVENSKWFRLDEDD